MIFRTPALVALTVVLTSWLVACEPQPDSGGTTSAPTVTATATATARPKTKASASAKPQGPPLLHPKAANAKAPDRYKVKFTTTKGDFVIEVIRDWSPRGADRIYNLVQIGFYKDIALHRVVKGFVVQFGVHGDPQVSAAWRKAYLMDELVKESNRAWTLTFAKSGPDTRTTQVFINLQNNPDLDDKGFSPFGRVIAGKDVIEKLYSGYGEKVMARGGAQEMFKRGNAFLKEKWPKLDYIKSAAIVP